MFAKLKSRINKRALPLLLVILLIIFGFNKAVSVMAAGDFGIKGAAQGTSLIGTNQSVQANTTVPELIGKIVGFVLSFVGAIFFLLILYAGLLWMIAFGNGERVDKAKSIVEHAAVGLVIVLAAYAISRFVFSNLTSLGSNSQSFTNPTAVECNAITDQAACESAGCGWLEGSGCFL
jgi:hypothetical protein